VSGSHEPLARDRVGRVGRPCAKAEGDASGIPTVAGRCGNQ
jgi:hypothetical protein